MKKAKIIGSMTLFIGLVLIGCGIALNFLEQDKKTPPKKEEQEQEIVKEYVEIGKAAIKETQTFNNLKYTQNHLSSTDIERYASFTSVVYNETGNDVKDKNIAIDFYDETNKLLGTLNTKIALIKKDESTTIFATGNINLTTASKFIVREIS